jgi:hypothetical protein
MVAILGTSRHGKSLFINQILRALELPDRSYNPNRRNDAWKEVPTATHAARHVARMLCTEADERERNAPLSKEDREERFNSIVEQIIGKGDPFDTPEAASDVRDAAMVGDIGGAKVIRVPSKHSRVTWGLPCGPSQDDESDEPGSDGVFNSKGVLNRACADKAFVAEAEKSVAAAKTFKEYAEGLVGAGLTSIGGSDGEFLLPSVRSEEPVTPISVKISGGEQYVLPPPCVPLSPCLLACGITFC